MPASECLGWSYSSVHRPCTHPGKYYWLRPAGCRRPRDAFGEIVTTHLSPVTEAGDMSTSPSEYLVAVHVGGTVNTYSLSVAMPIAFDCGPAGLASPEEDGAGAWGRDCRRIRRRGVTQHGFQRGKVFCCEIGSRCVNEHGDIGGARFGTERHDLALAA